MSPRLRAVEPWSRTLLGGLTGTSTTSLDGDSHHAEDESSRATFFGVLADFGVQLSLVFTLAVFLLLAQERKRATKPSSPPAAALPALPLLPPAESNESAEWRGARALRLEGTGTLSMDGVPLGRIGDRAACGEALRRQLGATERVELWLDQQTSFAIYCWLRQTLGARPVRVRGRPAE